MVPPFPDLITRNDEQSCCVSLYMIGVRGRGSRRCCFSAWE
jgi:hypothetical protein